MKPIAFFLLTSHIALCSCVSAQSSFRLVKPTSKDIKEGRYFSLLVGSKRSSQDSSTFNYIVKIYYAESEAIFHKLKIVYVDSVKSKIDIVETRIQDSLVVALFKQSDSVFLSPSFKVVLIESEDFEAQYPIVSIFQQTAVAHKDTVSYMEMVEEKATLKISGSAMITGQYSNGEYLYQAVPQKFIRGQLNLNADFAGIPISSSFYYTSENNTGLNQLNNFRISFRQEEFLENIRTKVNKRIDKKRLSQLTQLSSIDITAVEKELLRINGEINSKEYQRQLLKNKKLVEQMVLKDSSLNIDKRLQSRSYRRALEYQQDYNDKISRIKALEELKSQYMKYKKYLEFDESISELKHNPTKSLRKNAKRYGIIPKGTDFLFSVNKLDLGTFNPNYTSLVLGGVNLTGVNLEINPGYFYGAFTAGKVVSNFSNPIGYPIQVSGGRNILSGRIGIGRTDKFLIAMSVLKGTDDSGNLIKDSASSYYQPNYNYVLGADVKYNFTKNVSLGIEYAKSQSQLIGSEDKNTSERLVKMVDNQKGKYSNAWNMNFNAGLNNGNTKIRILSRVVDPFYYSFGAPNLRKDNFRLELRFDQYFWKKQLSTGVTYRRDADNLQHLKEGTSKINALVYTLQLRLKKMPYVIINYAPTYQGLYDSRYKQQINTKIVVFSAIAGYVVQKSDVMFNTMLTMGRQVSRSNQDQWVEVNRTQYGVMESVMLLKQSLTFTAGMNITVPDAKTDTSHSVQANVSVSKGVYHGKGEITLGSRYQKDFFIQERYVIEAGSRFNLGYGITIQLQVEKHFVTSFKEMEYAKDMYLGRLTIIKTF